MTDKEIIKALECCKSDTSVCGECPYDKVGECIEKMCTDSIDLINRQQAENERLKKEKDEYAYLYDKHINTAFSHIKAEAYKEFAKKLKDSFFDNGYESPDVDFDYFVDNLLKEIIGE